MDIRKLNPIKRRKKYLNFILNIPIRSKRKTPNKKEIQKLIIDKMKRLNKTKLTKDIAVQIIAVTGEKGTPNIAKFIKNIIDIMHKLYVQDGSNFLSFNDDNQIKYLYVKYVLLDREPFVHIKIRPFSSFISDLHFIDNHLSDYKKELDSFNNDYDNDDSYNEFSQNRESYLKFLSKEAFDSLLKMSLGTQQRNFGNLISINPLLIQTLYPKKDRYTKYFKDIDQNWAELLMTSSIRLKLPGIPIGLNGSDTTKEQKNAYKESIKKSLYQYRENISIIKNLQSPIIVSVIYRPAKKSLKKDIDNIMLEYIIPVANEVLEPPASHYGLTEYKHDNKLIKVPLAKDLHGMSIGYEIIYAPRFKQKHNEGELYLGFRLDRVMEDTLIDKTDELIEQFLKSEDYKYL